MSASKIGGLPSYVELITCLEMARDVERMRATSPETTGAGGATDTHRQRHRQLEPRGMDIEVPTPSRKSRIDDE